MLIYIKQNKTEDYRRRIHLYRKFKLMQHLKRYDFIMNIKEDHYARSFKAKILETLPETSIDNEVDH